MSTSHMLTETDEKKTLIQQWVYRKRQRLQLNFGLTFSNLEVYGTVSSNSYQHTVGNYALHFVRCLGNVLRRRQHDKVQILRSMDGLVRSGEMLLVLGRPRSGCSTFLKTVAGETNDRLVGSASVINYEGIPYSEMHRQCKNEAMYVAELDVHFPELTLGQTLGFAARASPFGHGSSATEDGKLVASMFNLEKALRTPVGNDMIKGLSGGEKKRTSIAEAFMGRSQLQCWDNSTRGLDNLMALGLITMLRGLVNEFRSTVLFNKIMLLYEGQQIFFGSTSLAAQYFTALGFERSPQMTTPDFLTSITNPTEHIVKEGYETRVPRSPEEFAKRWQQSLEKANLAQDIASFNKRSPSKEENGRRFWEAKIEATGHQRSSGFALPIASQISICLRRAIHRLQNNPGPTVSAIFGNAIIGIIVGSMYFDLDSSSASMDSRAVLLFFAVMVNGCLCGFEILTIWAQRPIVEKHNRYSFYRPFTDASASMIADLLNKFLSSLFFNLSVYFMTNLRKTTSAFFVYFLFCFAALLSMSMMFRMIGSISKRIEQSIAPGSIMVNNFVIYSGFVVPIPYMKPWFGWIRWINPIFYAYESIMINEFRDRVFPCATFIPSGPAYTSNKASSKICAVIGAKSGEDFIGGENYIQSKYKYQPEHLWRNLGLIIVLMFGYCVIYLLAVEFVSTDRTEGEILRFRRKYSNPNQKRSSHDEEAAAVPQPSIIEQRLTENLAVREGYDGMSQKIQEKIWCFSWSNVSYDVSVSRKEKSRILDGVDGWVKPGTLTAVMGATGAGKTTLLDVLADRVSAGVVSGEIYVNGVHCNRDFQRQTGYVQQADIHLPTTTVREALMFSAFLRQPKSRTTYEKQEYVEYVLDILEMGPYADAIVGVPGEGLNVEQRRRLSIGAEIAARPERLLFLDEPTSGLDSQTAWSICILLRKLAGYGQAILCTIHQPSAQLFQMFDQLLLLEPPGRTLYFGGISPSARTLTTYFEQNGARHCNYMENPAEWMLDVTGGKNKTQWAKIWQNNNEMEHATSYFMQFVIATRRIFEEYWRTPSYVYSKLALWIGAVTFFNGFSFSMSSNDIQGVTNILFSVFIFTVVFAIAVPQTITRFVTARAFFEAREMRLRSYSWVVFVASQIVVELVWQTIASMLAFVAWYYPTGLWRNGNAAISMNERAGLIFLLVWMFCLFSSTLAQALSSASEHAETATNLVQLLFYLCIMFCGVLVTPAYFPGFWKFMYRTSPLTFLIQAMVSATTGVLLVDPPLGTTCASYFASYIQSAGGTIFNPHSSHACQYCPVNNTDTVLSGLGVHPDQRWRNFGIFWVYIVINIGATLLFYRLTRLPWTTRQHSK
ncbi:putative ABC multidrug transporter [Lojkania enalia]|uniref:ABC multidrug transporter n=1 Tax=Lojkania enalia TaxID=147567 RepID=A0A9P4K6J6_9PLEO|nr:putative ABC multidrug transporter [Didymosphaeria enalia]